MSLIDDVKNVLLDLSPHGWKQLFAAHGLDIEAVNLASELTEKELDIDTEFPGFDDFAKEGNKGITSGMPARSLLYHALASPKVIWSDKNATNKLSQFPTLKQIEIVENFVFGVDPPSLAELEIKFGRENLAVVIFANQYRSAIDTNHKKHADLLYSRTGVSRVGTAESLYDAEKRSFDPLVADEPNKIRVLPAKYNAYIAVKMKGSKDLLGGRFNQDALPVFTSVPGDSDLDFWHPVQKLFNGKSLRNIDIKVDIIGRHTNEKIKKIHKFLQGTMNINSGSDPSQHQDFPFIFNDEIADVDPTSGFVTPIKSEALVKKSDTTLKKMPLPVTNRTPDILPFNPFDRREQNSNSVSLFSSSLEMRKGYLRNSRSRSAGGPREVPEYMHIRTKSDGKNLNDEDNLREQVKDKEYSAVHYVDFTGDGIVSAQISSQIPLSITTFIPAYSLVTAPDFFPYCDQSEIFDKRRDIWSRPPFTLADVRIRPNIQSHPDLFHDDMQDFDTVTSIIPWIVDEDGTIKQTKFDDKTENRISYLTDSAAGFFAPGWDTSFDNLDGLPHLAAYGLGSPFPEDAKLCAAISSFWPAVAPDIARSFWTGQPWRTIIPLTDSEVGMDGADSWDGENGPSISNENGKTMVTFKDFDYVDYTLNALENKFNYHILAPIDSIEYIERVDKLLEARRQLGIGANAILISYKISSDRKHFFRFMTDFKEVENKPPFRKIEVISEREITL